MFGKLIHAALFTAILLSGSTSPAQDDPMKLRGLGRLSVFVPTMIDHFEKQGLRLLIQTDAELRLRQAGVVVVDPKRATDELPYLEIRVTSAQPRRDTRLIAYQVQALLHESVRVQRTGVTLSVVAITWESNVYTGSQSNDLEALRAHVRDRVDEFVNAYLAANPRR